MQRPDCILIQSFIALYGFGEQYTELTNLSRRRLRSRLSALFERATAYSARITTACVDCQRHITFTQYWDLLCTEGAQRLPCCGRVVCRLPQYLAPWCTHCGTPIYASAHFGGDSYLLSASARISLSVQCETASRFIGIQVQMPRLRLQHEDYVIFRRPLSHLSAVRRLSRDRWSSSSGSDSSSS